MVKVNKKKHNLDMSLLHLSYFWRKGSNDVSFIPVVQLVAVAEVLRDDQKRAW